MRYRILLAAAFLYLAVSNLIWIARDTRPPFWDMAAHQSSALRIYDAFGTQGPAAVALVPKLTGYYPPFYHFVVAGFAQHYSRDLKALNDYVLGHPESFHVVEWFPLPNGEVIRLYRVATS